MSAVSTPAAAVATAEEVIPEGFEEVYANILYFAREEFGFEGFGGECGLAAMLLNKYVFQGQGTLVAAVNKALWKNGAGSLVGHVAIRWRGSYWDVDGEPKDLEDVESWGMLDPEDRDWIKAARKAGVTWDEVAAEEVVLVELTETEIMQRFKLLTKSGVSKVRGQEVALFEGIAELGDYRFFPPPKHPVTGRQAMDPWSLVVASAPAPAEPDDDDPSP